MKERNISQTIKNIILEANQQKISNVTFTPKGDDVTIKYSKVGSGEVSTKNVINLEEYHKYVRYLKFQTRLDISNNKREQSGGFCITTAEGKVISSKVSTIPSENSEILELRIYADVNEMKLKDWLKESSQYEKMYDELKNSKPGLFVISGPSSSGKTLLSNQLMNLIAEDKKVVTVEDPIEILNDNLVQMQINEDMNITIDMGIRAALLQEPDYLFVAKIDSPKTVEAIKSAINDGKVVIVQVNSNNLVEAQNLISDSGFTQDEIINISNQSINKKSLIEIQLLKEPKMELCKQQLEDIIQSIYNENFELGSTLANIDFSNMIENLDIEGKLATLSEDNLIKEMISHLQDALYTTDYAKNDIIKLLNDRVSDTNIQSDITTSLDKALK